MVTRSPLFRLVVFLLVIGMPAAILAAGEKKNEPVGKGSGGGDSIQWQTSLSGHDRIVLTVLAPDGEVYTKSFSAGRNPSFSLQDLPGRPEDGEYTFELTVMPRISGALAKQLSAARAAGDDKKAREIMRASGLSNSVVQSGAFTVSGGLIVNPNLAEGDASDSSIGRTPSTDGVSGSRTTPSRPGFTPAVEDQVIPDDLIVQGSECVGLDCVNNENFGFDTIRLKENNLRIHFDDTSTQAGFPANDWRLIANDSASGGQSKFSIEDSTGVTTPFTVEAGASSNSIYVDSTGRIGLRTSTPVLDLHINTSNTPSIRLEQNNSGGFTAQTWDIAGNEANFFVRDVTSGSRLPFRIRPGAPTSTIDISSDGDVGIGTASPDALLNVEGSKPGEAVARFTNTSATGFSGFEFFDSDAATQGLFLGTDNTANNVRFNAVNNFPIVFFTNSVEHVRFDSDGDVGINCNNPTSDLVIATTTAGCTGATSSINAGQAQFIVTSSRSLKENLEPVAVPDLLERISKIDVYEYDFKKGPKDRIGLMAEDFHQVFGRGDEKQIDGGEVQLALWMAVQQLTAQNKELTDRLAKLEKELGEKQP